MHLFGGRSRTTHPFWCFEHSDALVLSLMVGLQVLAVGCKSAGDKNVSGTAEAASPGAAAAAPAAAGEPTPPETILLTTKTGQNFRLSSYNWSLAHAPQPFGVPTASGVEISLNYASRVEFGVRSDKWSGNDPAAGSWPVTITLLDGTLYKDDIGGKADSLVFRGSTDLGSYETHLQDVKTMVIQRKAAPQSIPKAPPADDLVMVVETRAGRRTRVSKPKFRATCSTGYINVDHWTDEHDFVPTVGGLNIDLKKIRVIEGYVEGDKLTATITTIDGQSRKYEIDRSTSCYGGWNLYGAAALGEFDIPLSLVKRIEVEKAPSGKQPAAPAQPGLAGTLIGKQGQSLEFTGLTGGLPLKSGLTVDLEKIRTAEFGQESSGQVPVTVTVLDGRVVRDTVDGTFEIKGDFALGTFSFKANEIRRVSFKH